MDFPITCAGSGGSLGVAAFCAKLHESKLGRLSSFSTPLDLMLAPDLRDRAVILFTARGKNPDVVQLCQYLARREPKEVLALILTPDSPASRVFKKYPWMTLLEFTPPIKRDGYLATNSMLASCVLLQRAYSQIWGLDDELPKEIPAISLRQVSGLGPGCSLSEALRRPTLSVLYGGWGKPAAIDIESKLTEAGLTNVQVTDFRNFGHGRHYWLARQAQSTVVLSLTTPETKKLSDRTMACIPKDIPAIELAADDEGPIGALELIMGIFKITEAIGAAQGADPARPCVPPFGRKIYHLGISDRALLHSRDRDAAPLGRKFGDVLSRWPSRVIESAKLSLAEHLLKFEQTRFRAIILDYDNTLCPPENRFGNLPRNIVKELNRLLRGGILIGIATGRGRSVRQALRHGIPLNLWSRVIVGYYNGSEIFHLNGSIPDSQSSPMPVLNMIAELMKRHPQLLQMCDLEARPRQLSLVPIRGVSLELIYKLAMEITNCMEGKEVFVIRSAHAVDIVPCGISKLRVLEAVANFLGAQVNDEPILCIADSGTWDGNDLQLLSTRYSLSVDRTPLSASGAWNIAPEGHRGVQATLDYLRNISIRNGFLKLNVKRLTQVRS